MGYCTDYKLTIKVSEEKINFEEEAAKILASNKTQSQKQSAIYALGDITSDTILSDFCSALTSYNMTATGELTKAIWEDYEHDYDLIEFSKKYPNALFILDGVGEEYPDIWRKYFKNGKMYREDFGESKLA